MSRIANRRSFFKSTALSGAGVWLTARSFADSPVSANEEIQFACIGVGGKGRSDSADAGKHGRVVAICDIDERNMEKAAGRFKEAKRFFDFRDMYQQMGDRIDAVTVSTPDHIHTVAAVMGMKMGKHCFTQKPLTHSIFEARTMARVAREMEVATQMGNQGTASSNMRRTAEQIKAGALGTCSEIHCWTNRPVWPQGVERPVETPAVPAHVHWEGFIGPAPMRPYHPAYHPFSWRGWWDFGTGALGDMACHTLNLAFMALDLRDPVSVEATTPGHNNETFPGRSVIKYRFPERNGRPPLTLTWYDGGERPSAELMEGISEISNSGLLVVGEKGKMYSPSDYGSESVWMPEGKIDLPNVEIRESPGHFTEWVHAIRGGDPAVSNFADYSGPLTETVLLGNLAVWSGKKVEWDAKNMKARGAAGLESIVRREYRQDYREGFTL